MKILWSVLKIILLGIELFGGILSVVYFNLRLSAVLKLMKNNVFLNMQLKKIIKCQYFNRTLFKLILIVFDIISWAHTRFHLHIKLNFRFKFSIFTNIKERKEYDKSHTNKLSVELFILLIASNLLAVSKKLFDSGIVFNYYLLSYFNKPIHYKAISPFLCLS